MIRPFHPAAKAVIAQPVKNLTAQPCARQRQRDGQGEQPDRRDSGPPGQLDQGQAPEADLDHVADGLGQRFCGYDLLAGHVGLNEKEVEQRPRHPSQCVQALHEPTC